MGVSLPVLGVPGMLGGGALPPLTVANLAHWYNLDSLTRLYQDSAMTTPVAADGNPVGAWVDQIVAADEIAQTVTAAKPTYRTSVAALNNRPALQLDGGDYLTGTFTANVSQPATHYVVGIMSVVTGALFDSPGSTTRHHLYYSPPNLTLYAGTTLAQGGGTTNATIFICVFNGASSRLFKNGVAGAAAGNAGTQAADGLIIGTNRLANLFMTGYYAEHLIYGADHTAVEKNTVQNYLAKKYNISVTVFS